MKQPRCALYRLCDPGGRLLYIGITGDPGARFGHHASVKCWWPEVRAKQLVWYATREEAKMAEAAAIRAEQPCYNIHFRGNAHGIPAAHDVPPLRKQLGAELLYLRELAQLRQPAVAEAIGVSACTVSRMERGLSRPSWREVKAWVEACDAAGVIGVDMEYLGALTDLILGTQAPYKAQGGLGAVEERIGKDEMIALTMRNFSNWGLPGLLQTPGYARSVLRLADMWGGQGGAAAAAKRQGRQAILSDPHRKLEFLVTEQALRWPPVPPAELKAQLDYVAAVMAWPTITVHVIPGNAAPHALGMCPFVLYEDLANGDSPYAEVEMSHRAEKVDTAEDVALYRKLYGLLDEGALRDDAAAEFVRQVAASLP
jgi:transcriptional regulator with XRE-family HTH domain